MNISTNRADGVDKDEWLERVRRACQIPPTEEELEHAWDEFISIKRRILDAGQTTLQ